MASRDTVKTDSEAGRPEFSQLKAKQSSLIPFWFLLTTLGLWTGCGGASSASPSSNPLTFKEVKHELNSIPRPLEEVLVALAGQQSDIPDYEKDWERAVTRDTEVVTLRIQGEGRSADRSVKFAQNYGPLDVVAFTAIMSWDGPSSGARGLRETATWTLYLNKEDLIIGYSELDYSKLK